jgi:hypothetical protein
MAAENPTWGAARIHGELLKLGVDLSERTVSRWVRRVPKNPDSAQRWLTFLRLLEAGERKFADARVCEGTRFGVREMSIGGENCARNIILFRSDTSRFSGGTVVRLHVIRS